MLATPPTDLRDFIQANTGDSYTWSDAAVPGKLDIPKGSPFAEGWNTGAYSAGLPPGSTPEQRREMALAFTDAGSAGAGLAAIWTPPPLDLGFAALAIGFKSSNYLLRPPTTTQIWADSATTIVPVIIPNGQVVQTGFAIGGTIVQPIVTPWLDDFSKPSCTPPRKC